jgi:quinolinate synthase
MTTTLEAKRAMSLDETRRHMRKKLAGIVPDFEIDWKAELAFEINALKREMNAVILGHNYMEPALYFSIADYVGDSLELARVSAQTDADIIVFCGVRFMAETAKILNPDKMVLIPSLLAGCSLAEGVTAEDVRQLREQYPGAPVVSYVNTYAEVKAESDYCCTSGNAEKVVKHVFDHGHNKVLFLPDEYLARNTAQKLGVAFYLPPEGGDTPQPDPSDSKKAIIGWRARCEVHEEFTLADVQNIRRQFPDAIILAHPECSPEVVAACDAAGSTKQMIDFVRQADGPRYALLTECSMGDNVAAEFPEKQMLRLCSIRCPHMHRITLEDTLDGLRKLQYRVELAPDLIRRARGAIDRMLAIR